MNNGSKITLILTGIIGGLALLYMSLSFAFPSQNAESISSYSTETVSIAGTKKVNIDTTGLGDREPEGSCDGSCGGGCGGGCGSCGGGF